MAIWLYRVLCGAAWILLALPLLYLSTKPKYRRSIPARFFPFVRVFTLESSGFCKDFCPHIWLHACSFGEIKSLEPIIQALAQADSTRNILLTTTTQTGFDLAQSSYASKPTIRVEFLPFEIFLPFYARRLKQLQALVVTEAELWLELFHTARALGAQTLLINARISTRSYPKYRRFRAFYRLLFSYIDRVFAQSQADSTRLAELGARNIHIFGNLKLLSPITTSKTYQKPKNRLVIVAASTHRGEEELVLEAFSALKKVDSRNNALLSSLRENPQGFSWQSTQTKTQNLESTFENNAEKSQKVDSSNGYPASAEFMDCHAANAARNDRKIAASKKVDSSTMDSSLLILAPRHPERFTQVATLLADYPLASARFTQGAQVLNDTSLDVILLDTLGELNNCYAIADIVILGGAFVPAGGHNPLEPAFFGTKLISGEAIFNQEALFACIDGYTLCKPSELESTLLAHHSLPHSSYKHAQAHLSTLIQAITTHKD